MSDTTPTKFSHVKPADSNWRSDGMISVFVYTREAVICGPGRLWNVALVCRPHHGSG